MIPKEHRLKKNKQFLYIYKHGESKHKQFLSLISLKTKYQPFKVGFTVSKKIGNSVTRSKVKRRLRESFNTFLKRVDENYNYIFLAREGISSQNYFEIKDMMQYLLEKSGKLKNE